MKQIKIKITGDIIALDYCTQDLPEDEDFYGNYYLTCGWNTVTGLYVNDSEDNVVKQKGKYVKTKKFFHHLFRKDGDHPLPVECHTRVYCEQEVEYNIRIEDDEEFDIKKVQLVKSDYECDEFPYFIVADYILYDGKEIHTDETDDYCPEEKCHDEFVIDELYD